MTFKINQFTGRFDFYEKSGRYKKPYWDDLRVPLQDTKLGGTKDPSFILYKNNDAGSQGVFAYSFSSSQEQELYFLAQLPHGYKEGTNLLPHIHWTPASNGAVGQAPSWGLEYTISNIGGSFVDTSIILTNSLSPDDDPIVSDTHYVSAFPDIDGTNLLISSILICRVFRNVSGDNFPDNVFGFEIDFHYEMDTAGSVTLYEK